MTTPPSEKSNRALALKQANGSTSHPPDYLSGERLISRAELRQFVNASDMALWRGLQARKCPAPVYIGARRYWRASDIARWLERKQTTEVQHGAS